MTFYDQDLILKSEKLSSSAELPVLSCSRVGGVDKMIALGQGGGGGPSAQDGGSDSAAYISRIFV